MSCGGRLCISDKDIKKSTTRRFETYICIYLISVIFFYYDITEFEQDTNILFIS